MPFTTISLYDWAKHFKPKDPHLNKITHHQLNFSSPFNLVTNGVDCRTKIKVFILYFDAFFSSTCEPIPKDMKVTIIKEGEVALAEVWPVGGSQHLKEVQA